MVENCFLSKVYSLSYDIYSTTLLLENKTYMIFFFAIPGPFKEFVQFDVGVNQIFYLFRQRKIGDRVDLRKFGHRLRLDGIGSLGLDLGRLDSGSNQYFRLQRVGQSLVQAGLVRKARPAFTEKF